MYFIVYIVTAKRCFVVPYTWIFGLQNHLELFLNNGINSNKQHKVFYTNNRQAFGTDNIPLMNFKPNENIGTVTNFPEEGWYICYVKKIKCTFSVADFFILFEKLNVQVNLIFSKFNFNSPSRECTRLQ